ncbi:MAG: hypothetical protein WBF81_04950, partial [Thermoplasmata archaeon]
QWIEPLLTSGAVFYFDDIWAFHGHPDRGELGAIAEFNRKGNGWLIPFDKYGTVSTQGHVYIFCRSRFEFGEIRGLEAR